MSTPAAATATATSPSLAPIERIRPAAYRRTNQHVREMTKVSPPRHLHVIPGRVESLAAGVDRRTMRILVIEDEPRIQAFLVRGLEAEGYTVVAADSGPEGLALAVAATWDLVVLDLLLPGLSGLRVLRELHAERPQLPVVILSARSDLQTRLRGFELGASDYVAKPFSLEELLARVRVQLRRTAPLDDEHA